MVSLRSPKGSLSKRARLGVFAVAASVFAVSDLAAATPSNVATPVSVARRADRCDCLTLWVPAPRELSAFRTLGSELRGSDTSVVLENSTGVHGRGERYVLLTTRMPAAGANSLADIGDVIFSSPDGRRVTVPIVLRVSVPGDAAASGFDEACVLADVVDPQSRRWTVGMEGSMGQSSLSGETAGFEQGRLAASATGFIDVASGPWALRGGIGLVQRGGQSDLGSSIVVIAVNYLDIPLTAQYRFSPLRNITPFVFGGASAAIRLDCNISISGSLLAGDEPCSGELGGGNPRPLDAVMHFGAGAAIPVGEGVLEVGLRSVLGAVSLGAPVEARNRGWSFVVSTRIPLNRFLSEPPPRVRPPDIRRLQARRCARDA
jgi:hypothetical protein